MKGKARVPKSKPPLWKCPKCGKTFVTRNLWHSCRRGDLDALFESCGPSVRDLYEGVLAAVRRCGPITVNPLKSAISLQVRVRAIGCVPLRRSLKIGLAFRERMEHPRFVKIESHTRSFHAHWLRIERPSDIDAELKKWIRRAYARAAQE